MYENAEKVADARSQQQRYIDQEVIAAAETDRRTLQTVRFIFPIYTSK
jgi:hypothetical protein